MRGALSALVVSFVFSACGHGDAVTQACRADDDCVSGHCIVGTGVCVQVRNPVDASVPDLAEPRDLAHASVSVDSGAGD